MLCYVIVYLMGAAWLREVWITRIYTRILTTHRRELEDLDNMFIEEDLVDGEWVYQIVNGQLCITRIYTHEASYSQHVSTRDTQWKRV